MDECAQHTPGDVEVFPQGLVEILLVYAQGPAGLVGHRRLWLGFVGQQRQSTYNVVGSDLVGLLPDVEYFDLSLEQEEHGVGRIILKEEELACVPAHLLSDGRHPGQAFSGDALKERGSLQAINFLKSC